MDIAEFIGLALAFGMMGMGLSGLAAFIDIVSVYITLGGTVGAIFTAFPVARIFGIAGIVKNAFFVKALTQVDTIKQLLEDRHGNNVKLLDFAGSIAPAFGMIGTLIGLELMLGNLSDVASIGPIMAVAPIIVKYLASDAGIDPARLSAVGYGECRPIVSNDRAENRQKNCRIGNLRRVCPEAGKVTRFARLPRASEEVCHG